MDNNNNSSVSVTYIVQVVFIVLKLTKLIDWSWWWVFSPIWINILATIIIMLLIIIVTGVQANFRMK